MGHISSFGAGKGTKLKTKVMTPLASLQYVAASPAERIRCRHLECLISRREKKKTLGRTDFFVQEKPGPLSYKSEYVALLLRAFNGHL